MNEKTKIFYFSTTGNSLSVARKISEALRNTELVSIPRTVNLETDTDADRIGFIFPVYRWGLPKMVKEFIKKTRLNPQQYVFAVATCGGTSAKVLFHLKKLICNSGGRLDAGFVTTEGANSVAEMPKFITFIRKLNKKKYGSFKERKTEIIDIIKNNKKHKPESSSFGANLAGNILNILSSNMINKMDQYFTVDDKCIQCKTCERLCPNGNIVLVDGKPKWNNNCELCNACIQWCPRQAIHYQNESCRYHNPEIKASDLFVR